MKSNQRRLFTKMGRNAGDHQVSPTFTDPYLTLHAIYTAFARTQFTLFQYIIESFNPSFQVTGFT